jgi:four helix bundle protein
MHIEFQNRTVTPTLSSEVGGFLFGDRFWVMGDGEKMSKKIESYEDLDVYQRLVDLHLQVHELTLTFPRFELYEIGSQLRRSSNSAPANLAEGWNNRHINIYLEAINRVQGEINETKHHLFMASKKKYLDQEKYESFINGYNTCGKMLTSLKRSLINFKDQRSSANHPTPMTQHQLPSTYDPTSIN